RVPGRCLRRPRLLPLPGRLCFPDAQPGRQDPLAVVDLHCSWRPAGVRPPATRASRVVLMKLLRLRQNPASPVGLYLGWIVWSSAFVSLYGAQGLGCSLGWTGRQVGLLDSLTLALVLLWLAHLGLLAWLASLAWRA